MNPSFPEVRVGEPMHCGALTVFPLYPERCLFSLEYLLASEAMAAGTVTVREVSEEGSVCELAVENAGDRPVLFLEGEELTGAKQNRAVSSSVVVAAGRPALHPRLLRPEGQMDLCVQAVQCRRVLPAQPAAPLQATGTGHRRFPPPGSRMAGNPAEARGDGHPFPEGKPLRCPRCAPRRGGGHGAAD